MKNNFPVTDVENDFSRDLHIASVTDLKEVTKPRLKKQQK